MGPSEERLRSKSGTTTCNLPEKLPERTSGGQKSAEWLLLTKADTFRLAAGCQALGASWDKASNQTRGGGGAQNDSCDSRKRQGLRDPKNEEPQDLM